MNTKDKHEYFLRISNARLTRILEALQSLGNCSNPNTYLYENRELIPIFQAINEKLAEVWQRMTMRSPNKAIPFRLQPPETVELAGHSFQRSQLTPMAEVVERLNEYGHNFVSLSSFRGRYLSIFGDDLCWRFPLCDREHAGCILFPVQEGILYLPYDAVDETDYEQFAAKDIKLLTEAQLQTLIEELQQVSAEQMRVLVGIQSYKLIQEEDNKNDASSSERT